MRAISLVASVMLAMGSVAIPGLVSAKATHYRGSVDVRPAASNQEVRAVRGTVFEDVNRDGRYNRGEPGIPDVLVSDGKHVVKTDAEGKYRLPRPTPAEEAKGISIFITKPAGYELPVDEDNMPQFFYVHKPHGSPLNVRGEPFRFGGLEPTGPLPRQINFPLIKGVNKYRFKVAISGDTQPYSNVEVGYVRDTLARELAGMNDVEAVIIEGDVMGDDLGLYPRFKKIMSTAGSPVYFVGGNHDLDFDAPSDDHSFDTFRREWGPEYYSFDIGEVHFVVLDNVRYPCDETDNADGLHEFCLESPTYNGVISPRQMRWLKNDLAHVPEDKLIVFNSHIPFQTYIDQNASKHQTDNILEVYDLLGYGPSDYPQRPALALSGHTHTLEQIRPGESYPGWSTALGDRSPGAPPFPQIVTGAAAGSWWSGDFTDNGIPMSYQRLGGPRGYLLLEFEGNTYKDVFKATGKSSDKQMSVSMLSPTFVDWSETLIEWLQTPAEERSETPPVNINDLPDTKIVTTDELADTYLIANVWNGSLDSKVYVQIDGGNPIFLERTEPGDGEISDDDVDADGFVDIPDPFALERQLQVARYAFQSESGNERAQGFELYQASQFGPADPQPLSEGLLTRRSMHLWKAKLPEDLEHGVHVAKVVTYDMHGNRYEEVLNFEVMDERPAPYFRTELFEVRP
jgi:hypothetical protein